MTTIVAADDGWHGFDGIGEKVEKGSFGYGPKRGGWLYRCDGMPTLLGCGAEVIVPRRWSRVGKKKGSGWLAVYGLEPKPGAEGWFDRPEDWQEDHDVVLTFCPSCAAVVTEQMKRKAG